MDSSDSSSCRKRTPALAIVAIWLAVIAVAALLAAYPLYALIGQSPADTPDRQRLWIAIVATLAVYAGVALSRILRHGESLRAELRLAREHLARANTELQNDTVRDKLTAILNRRTFVERLEDAMARAGRSGGTFSLIVVDLDHFKEVNDTFGQAIGDTVLREVAGILRNRIRGNDTLARWGGEEFAVIADGADVDEALVLAEGLRQSIAAQPLSTVRWLTASLGVAEYHSGESANDLAVRADRAVAQAKRAGRNRSVASPEVEAALP